MWRFFVRNRYRLAVTFSVIIGISLTRGIPLLVGAIGPSKILHRTETPLSDIVSMQYYEAVDIGMPTGGVWMNARAASTNFRYIVGSVSTRTITRPFLWHDGKFTYLSSLQAFAEGVNDKGEAVGNLVPDATSSHAVVWRKGRMTRLFDGYDTSFAKEIDNKGNMYGGRYVDNVHRAFLYRPNGTTIYFEKDAKRRSGFLAANEKGEVVFYSAPQRATDSKDSKYIVRQKYTQRELKPLKAGQTCRLQAINNKGVVVGMAFVDPYTPLPAQWKNARPSLLKTPAIRSGEATGINKRGEIVGSVYCKDKPIVSIAFLIRQDKFYDLNSLLIDKSDTTIEKALQISSTGVILAEGNVNNTKHAFLLRPVSAMPVATYSPSPTVLASIPRS